MHEGKGIDLEERLGRIESLLERLVEAQTSRPRPDREWFSIDEVAAMTGLSDDHIRRHVTSGLLPVSNQGTFDKPYYRIHRRDVDEWMMKRRETPSPAPRKKKPPAKFASRHHKPNQA